MKKLNKMCPICFIRQVFAPYSRVTEFRGKSFDNGVCYTPPMGWSSWNSFRNQISEKLILETADAFCKSGLKDAGYKYINLDDCWQSSMRDENGNFQADLTNFPHGIPYLVNKLNDMGLKVGAYSSNGTLTCEDLPASLNHEYQDAYLMAKWGIEYFKYDYCHHKRLTEYAPLICQMIVSEYKSTKKTVYSADSANLEGSAKVFKDNKMPSNCYVSGLDRNAGTMVFENVYSEKEGKYVLTFVIKKHGNYEKYLMIYVNDEVYELKAPACNNPFNHTARCQIVVTLNKGNNTIKLFNPVATKADSTMILYQRMGNALQFASKRVAKETGNPEKPIAYSICEWGRNQPYLWGERTGNLWRTTLDIRPWYFWIDHIYRKTVKLYKYVGKCNWNDPDMLEVGNGKLTENENIAHFSLWCMMSAPLILGNDLRKFIKPDGTVDVENKTLKIVTNKNLIAIDQDVLGKPAKPIKLGRVDLLARPIKNGVAVCVYNRTRFDKKYTINLKTIFNDNYINFEPKKSLNVVDLWKNEKLDINGLQINCEIPPHGVKVYAIF